MPEWIITSLMTYKYLIIFPLAWVEGPIVTFTVGSLAALGYFNVWIVYPLLVLTDFIPDLVYYAIGRFGHSRKVHEKFKTLHMHMHTIQHLWFKHTLKTMFLSKWAFGLSIPLLMSAGLIKLPISRYLLYTLPISMTQYAVFLFLGYVLGSSSLMISDSLPFFEVVIAAGLVLFFAGYTVMGRYAKKQIEQAEKTSEPAHK